MNILKIRPMAGTTHPPLSVHVRWRFDLDDICAPVSKLPYCGGPRPDTSQIQYSKPRKWELLVFVSHIVLPQTDPFFTERLGNS